MSPSTLVHSNGTVDLAWSALAGAVTWDRGAATCSTYCHGATLAAGGTNTLPGGTEVGSGQTACGTCHGVPPPAPHPPATACDGCHEGTVDATGAILVSSGRHIDGTVQLAGSLDTLDASADLRLEGFEFQQYRSPLITAGFSWLGGARPQLTAAASAWHSTPAGSGSRPRLASRAWACVTTGRITRSPSMYPF